MHRSYEGVAPGNGGLQGKTRTVETELALYNLRRDPGERYDVKSIYPEIVKELQLIAEEARADLGDDLLNIKGENVREPGRID